jgi:hypothetical protein
MSFWVRLPIIAPSLIESSTSSCAFVLYIRSQMIEVRSLTMFLALAEELHFGGTAESTVNSRRSGDPAAI